MEYINKLLQWVDTWKDDQIETSETMREYFGLKKPEDYHSETYRQCSRLAAARSNLINVGVIEKIGSYREVLLEKGLKDEASLIDARITAYKKGPLKLIKRFKNY